LAAACAAFTALSTSFGPEISTAEIFLPDLEKDRKKLGSMLPIKKKFAKLLQRKLAITYDSKCCISDKNLT
jgi:hypothetical protein